MVADVRDFHIIVRPLGAVQFASSSIATWSGAPESPLAVWSVAEDSVSLGSQAFQFPYEVLAASLSRVPRLFLEPDGAFVWVSPEDPARRVNGQITDDGEQVLYLELRGRCSFEDLAVIFQMLGWPEVELVYQLLPEAMLVRESQFREVLD